MILPADAFLSGGGEAGALMRAHDWSASPLGPPATWPQSLRSVVGLMLGSKFPMFVAWGGDLGFLYNDAYAEILGAKHPQALGRRFRDIWAEIWPDISPLIDAALAGEATYHQNLPLVMNRRGFDEQAWFTFSYSPVRDESGQVAGMFCACTETTSEVQAERRQAFCLALEERLRGASEPREVTRTASEALARHLGTAQAAFIEFDEDGEHGTIAGLWGDGRMPDLDGQRVRADDYGRYAAEQRAGLDVVVGDVTLDERFDEAARAAMAEIRSRAFVSTQLVRDGRLRASCYVAQPDARDWTEAEVALVRDVANRSWAAVERARAEAALRESQARLTRAVAVARLGTFEWNLTTGAVTLDDRSRELWGFEAREGATAQDVFDRVHPEDVARVWAEADATTSVLSRLDAEYRVCLPDGTVRSVASLSDAVPGPDGQAERMVGVFADVSERVRAEAALRATEARLRELNTTLETEVATRTAERDRMWDTSPDLMLIIDFHGVFRRVNPAWTEVLGYAPDELVGHHVNEFVLPSDHSETMQAYKMAAEGGQQRIENRYRHKDGSTRWISWTAAPAGEVTYATGRDVTAEKERQARLEEAEAARREADALYRAYFENTAEALFVVGVRPDGGFTIDELNPAHQAATGLCAADVQGRRIEDLLPPEVAEAVSANYHRATASEHPIAYREAPELPGGVRHWDTVLVPVRDAGGAVTRLVGSSRDVTAQVHAEEQLRQSQKMEAMGSLTGGVAHDFNNLLTPILGVLDRLLNRGVGSEREQRLMAGALESAERAKVLVQRLLAFARRQPLQPTAVDLPRLVQGMAELISATLGPTIDVRVELAPNLPPAQADANQLEMALLNLAVNARDAMPDGGTLTISAVRDNVRGKHRSELRVGHYVRLSVTDTGAGMDESTRERAVEPFFSTKGVGKGTGLGLSMVHGLAAQLGGGLVIKSELGQGTSVELWLPVSAELAGGADPRPAAERLNAPRGRALVVDDEAVVRMSTADMLADLGFEVREAGSAEEALRVLHDEAAVDLLVTDHLMPGLSGVDLARKVRALRPGLPILIVSGYADVEGLAPDLPRLGKPFRVAELADRVASVMPEAASVG